MTWNIGRKVHVAVLACGIVICVPGCGGREGGSTPSSSPSIPATTSKAASIEISSLEKYLNLPIGDYSFTPRQMQLIFRAEGKLADSCMQKYGLRYRGEREESPAEYVPGTNRRYGVLNPEVVAKYGYHFPEQAPVVSGPDLTGQEIMALNGGPKGSVELNGVKVPEGGCLGQAREALRGAHSYEKGATAARFIASSSFENSLTVPKVVTTTSAWSQCMKHGGFFYKTPLRALGAPENSGNQITRREISVAQRDLDCKRRTDLVSIWSNAEGNIQRSMIKENQKDLALLSAAHREVLAEARSIVR